MKKTKLALIIVLSLTICFVTGCSVVNTPSGESEAPQSESREQTSDLETEETELSIPQLNVDGNENIMWTAIDHATGYVVNLNGVDLPMQHDTAFTARTEEGTYTVKVKAIGNGAEYLDSDYSTEYTYDVVVLARYEVNLPTSDAFTVVGENFATETLDYVFGLTVNTAYYEGTPVVKVNGAIVTAEDGMYTVENVSGDLTITVEGLTHKKVSVTSNVDANINFDGESEVDLGSEYEFTLTVPEGYMAVIYVDGKYHSTSEGGEVNIGSLIANTEITLNAILKDSPFITMKSADTITTNESQAHPDEGYEGVAGVKLISSGDSATFDYTGTASLVEGENVIAKFMTTDPIRKYLPDGAEDKLLYEVSHVQFIITDNNNNTIKFQVAAATDLNRPDSTFAAWYNDAFITLVRNGYKTNFSNMNLGDYTPAAFKLVPEIKLNTTTGVASYGEGDITNSNFVGFGLTGIKSAQVVVFTNVHGYGIVLETLCGQDFVTKYTVSKSEDEGYTITGADVVKAGNDYTFTVTVDSAYEGTPVVKVNGKEVTPVNDVYTVENVSENLTIEVGGITAKTSFAVTVNKCESVGFVGENEVLSGEEYKFTLTVAEGYKAVVYVNGEYHSTSESGEVNVGVLTSDTEITINAVSEDSPFITMKSADTITTNESQVHPDEGYEGVAGVKLISSGDSATFDYLGTASLVEGDNVIAKFMTTDPIRYFAPTEETLVYEVSHVQFIITDNNNNTIKFQVAAVTDINRPNADFAVFYNDNFIGVVGDQFYTNFSNMALGSASDLLKWIPEIKLNTTTGVATYGISTIQSDNFIGFGVDGIKSAQVVVFTNVHGYGIVLETLCGHDFVTKYTVSKSEDEGYTITGADVVKAGNDYTFTVTVDPAYEGTPVVKVNGKEVTAIKDLYKVENVNNDLSITVEGLINKT